MLEERFEDFLGLISAIDKEIQRIKTAELARFGLRASDLMCVYHLQKHPEGLTSAEISRLANIDRAAVSRVVSRLADQGFVEVGEEKPADAPARYRALIRLTEKGAAAMLEVDQIINDVVARAGSDLTAENRQAMYDSMSLVLGQLRGISR